MPILRNARHERFCQAIVSGQVPEKAYETAGFKRNRGNAHTLKQRQIVSNRIAELLAEMEAQRKREVNRASEKAAVTKADVLRMLVEDREMARQKNQLGPAVRAAELLGKELGMFIDRQLRKDTDDIFETMDDAELRRLALERARQLSSDDSEPDATRH